MTNAFFEAINRKNHLDTAFAKFFSLWILYWLLKHYES